MTIKIGTAGWSVPRDVAAEFAGEGSALERYASRFDVAEINSSFHRRHRISTWERWRDSVPAHFRFSVKLPKTVTHHAKLADCGALLDDFMAQASLLGEKLAVLLVQLPPKLELDVAVAATFFTELKNRSSAAVACEPRNASWFTADAEALLDELRVARVAADPAISDAAARPGGWPGLAYWRLHGSPVVYRSSYLDRIDAYAAALMDGAVSAEERWCIFDNTASSAGAGDALALASALGRHGPAHRKS
jgi:uncharacterized protein YecE (DUF72 family)